MFRSLLSLLAVSMLLTACEPTTSPTMGTDGKPLPQVYRISSRDAGPIQFRILDSVNTLRQASGAAPLALNAQLNAAAATHSRDMSVQNRPWHFGSDGSSPIERIQRSGYSGPALGENISETFETELQTLSAWMDLADTRNVILDRNAQNLGFAWFQEGSGKIWWTLVTGG
ncbi:MAG: CAP domain-containing protein [Paracoccaceae bacterium]